MPRQKRQLIPAIMLTLLLLLPSLPAAAVAPGTQPFQRTWQHTDEPVAAQQVTRSWMWGPAAFTAPLFEEYHDSPGQRRVVQYFDKSRMEITFPDAHDDGVWYVTNGLLVRELMTGAIQVGNDAYLQQEPARINVAGDPDDPAGVTYWFMGLLQGEQATPEGTVLDRVLTPGAADGLTTTNPDLASYGVVAERYAPETGHTIAAPFWAFMNATGTVYQDGRMTTARLFQNPFYATGFPLTEAYWATVRVGGTPHDVLVQCFERRCLTYTPANPVAWQVEMGNVGQHYYRWRYGTDIPGEPPAMDIASYLDLGPLYLAAWPVDLAGNAGLILANQSPYPMTVTLDGPQNSAVTVPPCPNCAVYESPAHFDGCRDTLPEQYVVVRPGTYRVKVEFSGGPFTPARSYWTLVPNGGYNSCFYSVIQP
jgi:hypothetical protein